MPFRRLLQISGLLILCFVLAKNINYFPGFLRSMVTGHPPIPEEMPTGRIFLPLLPALKHVAMAGFYSEAYSPQFWTTSIQSRRYQQAQSALTPTLLDAENSLNYDYVLFDCTHPGCAESIMRTNKLERIIQINPNVLLARKIRSTP